MCGRVTPKGVVLTLALSLPAAQIMHGSSSLDELWASLTTTLNSGGMAVAATGSMPVVCGSWGLPAFCCYPCRRIRRAAWTNCLRECMFTLKSLWLAASCLWAVVAGLFYYLLIFPLECCCGPVLVWYVQRWGCADCGG